MSRTSPEVCVRGPSLNAMRAFEAVGRLGSVSVAASELNITPGAVSRQVKNLEAYLGTALLGRSGRGVRLTPSGEQFWSELESAFSQIAETVKRVRQRQLRSTLHIVLPSMLGSTWLVSRLNDYNSQMPDVDVVIHDNSLRSVTSIEARMGDADMIISWGRFNDTDTFIAEKLTEDEIFPVCSPKLRPGGNGLAGLPLIHRVDVPRFWKWPDWATFLTAVGIGGIDATRGIRMAGVMALDAARQGTGVLLANTTFARQELVEGRLIRPIAESMATTCGYWLLTSGTRSDRPEVMALRTWLLNEFADCCGGAGVYIDSDQPAHDGIPAPSPHSLNNASRSQELGMHLTDHNGFPAVTAPPEAIPAQPEAPPRVPGT